MLKTNFKGKVYVTPESFRGITAGVFRDNGFFVVDAIKDADVVVWTGGEDISPSIYGERPLRCVYFSERRDRRDVAAIAESRGKFLVGICRGAQLLNCNPNGGRLWQDINGHEGGHPYEDLISNETGLMNSVHHQQMRPGPDAVVVAESYVSNYKACEGQELSDRALTDAGEAFDPEVLWYPKTKSLLFQAHPEFGHPPTTKYFFSLMERYYEPTRQAKAA